MNQLINQTVILVGITLPDGTALLVRDVDLSGHVRTTSSFWEAKRWDLGDGFVMHNEMPRMLMRLCLDARFQGADFRLIEVEVTLAQSVTFNDALTLIGGLAQGPG